MAIPWSTTPPPAPAQRPLTIVRVPAARPLSAIITVERAIYLETHFWHGRTVPCLGLECEACLEGAPKRPHAYVGIYTQGDRVQQLLELTAAGAEPLQQYFTTFTSLRGCWMVARRAKQTANSRIEMVCKPADLSKVHLPPEPDLLAALTIIWRLPAGSFSQISDEPGTTRLAADIEKIRRSTKALDGNGRPHESRRHPVR